MNTGALVFVIVAVLLFLMVVAVGRYAGGFVQRDPGWLAARETYKHALGQLRDRPHDPAVREHILSAGHAYNFYPLPYGTRAEQLQALDDQLARGEISEAQHAHRRAIVART